MGSGRPTAAIVGEADLGYAPAMAAATILTLVRHGETSANLTGVWHGSTDTPLTDRGHQQAACVAQHLADRYEDARALYASPLQRARHTAEAIAKTTGLAPRAEPGVAEFDLGSWEEKTYGELLQEHKLWQHLAADPDFKPHGGESPRDVIDRFLGALQRIDQLHVGERVIIVTHGGALALALGALLRGRPGEWYDPMHNCAVSELVLSPEPELLVFNDSAHLGELA